MKRHRYTPFAVGSLCGPFLPLLLGTALCGLSITSSDAQQAGKKLSIPVIPKGSTQAFWKAVEAGARQAGKELDAEIIWNGCRDNLERPA